MKKRQGHCARFFRLGLAPGLVAIATIALGACASAPEEPTEPKQVDIEAALEERGLRKLEAVERIPGIRVNEWRYLDLRHVVIGSGPTRQYLLELGSRCQGLLNAENLGFTTTGGSLTTLDQVVIQSDTAPTERCGINAIVELEKLDEEAGE